MQVSGGTSSTRNNLPWRATYEFARSPFFDNGWSVIEWVL